MTLESLIQASPDSWRAMTRQEVESYLAQYLNFTRPELVEKESTTKKSHKPAYKQGQLAISKDIMDLAKTLGIDQLLRK